MAKVVPLDSKLTSEIRINIKVYLITNPEHNMGISKWSI